MVGHFKEGHTPEQSLTKVANSYDLPPGLVRIVGRAFNAGQTLTELNQGSTLAEKTAGSRPICDIETVVADLFTNKAAQITPNRDVVASVYQEVNTRPLGKAAEAVVTQPVVPETVSDDRLPIWAAPQEYSAKEKMAEIVTLRRYIQDLDRQYSTAMTQEKVSQAAFESVLKQAMAQPQLLTDLRQDAQRFHGESGLVLFNETLDKLASVPAYAKMQKEAAACNTQTRSIPSSPSHPVLKKLAAACSASSKAKDASKKQLAGRLFASKTHNMISGKDKVPSQIDVVADTKEKKAHQYMLKFAAAVSSMLGGLAGARSQMHPGMDASSTGFRDAELDVDDVDYERRIKNIRLQATLGQLLSYDPVIQAYNPDEVLSAFNELSQSAPTVVDNPVALRANLRRMLQGDLAMHEAAQITKEDTDNRKLLTPLSAQV